MVRSVVSIPVPKTEKLEKRPVNENLKLKADEKPYNMEMPVGIPICDDHLPAEKEKKANTPLDKAIFSSSGGPIFETTHPATPPRLEDLITPHKPPTDHGLKVVVDEAAEKSRMEGILERIFAEAPELRDKYDHWKNELGEQQLLNHLIRNDKENYAHHKAQQHGYPPYGLPDLNYEFPEPKSKRWLEEALVFYTLEVWRPGPEDIKFNGG